MSDKVESIGELERSIRSLERRLVEKYAELDGLRLRDYSSTHEEYIHFLEHVIKSLRNRFKSDDSSQHAEPSYSGESDDEQDNVDTELRDLYFQLKDSEEKLKELKELRMPELHNAAYRGDLKDTELLLEAGADAMEKFFTGLVEESFQGLCSKATSPLAIAIWKGKLEVAKLLAMNMPHDYDDPEALEFALEFQDPKRLQILVGNGIVKHFQSQFRSFVSSAGFPNKNVRLAIMSAKQRLECLKILLEAGADVNDAASLGLHSPFNAPVISSVFDQIDNASGQCFRFFPEEDLLMFEGMVKLLLAYGAADPNIFPKASSLPSGIREPTPVLKRAVDWGMEQAVSDLLAAGADPHQDISFTDLHNFPVDESMQERREACKKLVEKAKGTPLSLKNQCRNFIIGQLYSRRQRANSAQTGLGKMKGSGFDDCWIESLPNSIKFFLRFEALGDQESKSELDSTQ